MEPEDEEPRIRGGNNENLDDTLWDSNQEDLVEEDEEENDDIYLEDESEIVETRDDLDHYDRDLANAEALLDPPNIDENDSSAYVDRLDLADAYDDLGMDTEDFDVPPGDADTASTLDEDAPNSPEVIKENAAEEVDEVISVNVDSPADTEVAPDFIDDDTRNVLLKELNYRRREVDKMKPEIATLVATKKLFRPPEGIPEHWNRSITTTTSVDSLLVNVRPVLRRIAKIAIPVMVVLFAAKGPILHASKTQRAKSAPNVVRAPAVTAVPVSDPDVDSTSADTESSSDPLVPEYLPLTTVDSPTSSHHPHSVKPGTSKQTVVQNENDLDVTWLDKFITKLENKIKALLQWEL